MSSAELVRTLAVTAAVAAGAAAVLLLLIFQVLSDRDNRPAYWPPFGADVHSTLIPVVQSDGRTALCCVDPAVGVLP